MERKSFSLSLLKTSVRDFDEAFSKRFVEQKLGKHGTYEEFTASFATGAKLVLYKSWSDNPKWSHQLSDFFATPIRMEQQSWSGVLVFRECGRFFAVTFGYGWTALDRQKVVDDFGLKAVVNSLSDEAIKSIQHSNLSTALNSVDQSPTRRSVLNFGIQDSLEILKQVSGTLRTSDDDELLTGSRSIKMSAKIDLDSIPQRAAQYLSASRSKRYKDTAFAIIDSVTPVYDKGIINRLDNCLINSVLQDEGEFELSVPELPPNEIAAFKFVGVGKNVEQPDLVLKNYISVLGSKARDLSPKKLRSDKIICIFEDGPRRGSDLKIHEALVGSLEMDGDRYAIDAGRWYLVSASFKQANDQFIDRYSSEFLGSPRLATILDGDGNEKYESELSFNSHAAVEQLSFCMDQKEVETPGIARSGIELCDILDIGSKKMIHVKKSSRKSAVLSHFFSQASTSARNFSLYPGFKENAFIKVGQEYGELAEAQFRAVDATTDPWQIELWILDKPRRGGGFAVPFFSRATFKEQFEYILGLSTNFKLKIRYIATDRET